MNILKYIEDVISYSGVNADQPGQIVFQLKKSFGIDNKDQIKEIIDKYRKYCFFKQIQHFGKDLKYVKSEEKTLSLDMWLASNGHKASLVFPRTPLTEYLFGEHDYYDLVKRANKLKEDLKKQREENIKKYNYERYINRDG